MSITGKPTEYDVTFAVKEWLLKHGWSVVAFNPPGSQGTFTIPNPAKDPNYRGQTGSESPDIIAVKNGSNVLIVEAKPEYNQSDAEKLLGLYESKARLDLMLQLLEKVCVANGVPFEAPVHIILAKAHGGEEKPQKNLSTFLVSVDASWSPEDIDPKLDPFELMSVKFIGENPAVSRVVEK